MSRSSNLTSKNALISTSAQSLIVAPIKRLPPFVIVIASAVGVAALTTQAPNLARSLLPAPPRAVPQAQPTATNDNTKLIDELRARIDHLEHQKAAAEPTARAATLPAVVAPPSLPMQSTLIDESDAGSAPPPPTNKPPHVAAPPQRETPSVVTPQAPVAPVAKPAARKVVTPKPVAAHHKAVVKPAATTYEAPTEPAHEVAPPPMSRPAYPAYAQPMPIPIPLPFFGGRMGGFRGGFPMHRFGGGFGGHFGGFHR